jgi:hypothetical protein
VHLRIFVRLVTAVALTAGLVVGGFTAAPPSLAAPSTVLRKQSIAPEILLPGPARRLDIEPDGRLTSSAAARTGTAEVCSPIWFTALGVTWRQTAGRPIAVDVSTSRDGASFGRDRTLDAEGGPDPGTSEYLPGAAASQLLWTGGRRCARISLRLTDGASLSDIQVSFINSSGTAAGPDATPEVVPTPAEGALGVPAADAMTRKPRFISRQRWGANPRLLNCKPDVAPEVKMGFVHHTVTANRYPKGKSDDIVRAIYAYHTRGQGWCDIAYNFLVDRFGRAFEGRSGGITNPVVGAAQQGFNTGAFSVALMGTYGRHRPPRPMIRGLRRVIAWRLDVAHIPPHGRAVMVSGGGPNTRYRKGKRVELPVISAHRYTGYTECPGKRVARRLPRLRDAVTAAGKPKIYRPSVSPDSRSVVGGREPFIHASASDRLVWSVTVLDQWGAEVATFPDEVGDTLRLTWSSVGSHPLPSTPGRYEIVIRGATAGGKRARSAFLPFGVSVE